MKNQNKGFVVPVLLGIIALLVIGGGVYMYNNKKAETPLAPTDTSVQTTNQIQQNAVVNTPNPSTSSNDGISTAGWKTYANATYNYIIKYPSTWYINTQYSDQNFTPRGPAPSIYMGGDTSITNYSDSYMENYRAKNGDLAQPSDYFEITLHFTQIDPSISLTDYLKNPAFMQANTTENINLNGTAGVKDTYLNITGIGGNTKPNKVGIFLKNNNEIIDLGYGFDSSVKSLTPTGDAIIGSFTLTK